MSLHHRIWELVAMICQPRGQEAAQVDDTVVNDHETDTSVSKANSQEAEISRLTWAVIDGKASDFERRRLAELVSAQHGRRQR